MIHGRAVVTEGEGRARGRDTGEPEASSERPVVGGGDATLGEWGCSCHYSV